MKCKLLGSIALALAAYSSAQAQEHLYACGKFNNWDAMNPVEFSYSEGLYSAELDFSVSADFKISTKKGVNGNGWNDFDEGTIALGTTANLDQWLSIHYQQKADNITAPAQERLKVTVDLDNMLIKFGEGAVHTAWSGTLPVLFINTTDNVPVVEKEKYLDATWYIDPMGLPGVEGLGTAQEPLTTQIKGRGNYTWLGFEKKPYRLKFTSKQTPLGMPKSKHFVLLAHADDNDGFLRNETGLTLSKMLGMPWTPESKPVELVLNGEYRGLYFLTQNIRVDSDRVDIVEQEDLATTDVDGGWLVEIDNYDTDPHVTVLENGNADSPIWFTYKSPEELSSEQENYLLSQMQAIDNAVYSSDIEGNDTELSRLVDFNVLARYYITQEIVDDCESFHGSCYLNRDRGADTKWKFGPVWDFGNAFNRRHTDKFIWQDPPFSQVWIGAIYRHPAFLQQVKEIWSGYIAQGPETLKAHLETFTDEIAVAAQYDAHRWPEYGNKDVKSKLREVQSLIDAKTDWLKSQWGAEAAIAGVEDEKDALVDVYTLQGMKVLTKASKEQIRQLPTGLYITPKGKVLVK